MKDKHVKHPESAETEDDVYDREGIESADDTGLIAGEELITNAQILQGLNQPDER
ncbi:MAG: hypothetical protein WCE44_09960 [Candidatus Velthaea sp.]